MDNSIKREEISSIIEEFHLKAKNTTVRNEVIGGITTFLAMAYILGVNPAMLAEGGMLIVVATIDKESKTLLSAPYVMTRGFIYVKESEELMNEVKQIATTEIETLLANETNELLVMKNRIKKALERHLYEKTKRRPSIFPMIMEV